MTRVVNPTNFPIFATANDLLLADQAGGRVIGYTAGETLLVGDAVSLSFGGRIIKNLESSLSTARFVGIVVGGASLGSGSGGMVTNESADVGLTAATVGQIVWVQVDGICYGIADATGIATYTPLTNGRTTAGRIIGDQKTSYTETVAGMVIKSGGSAITKSANAFVPHILGVAGTATAANLDAAAFSGTTANAKFAVYVFRVAGDGTTVTSAKSADADTLAALLWPTGSPILCTYGAVIINPTGTGGFVGGTTALDDATVVPNAKYIDLSRNRNIIGYAMEAGGAAGTAIKLLLSSY